jgi:hypothetical protein
MYERECKETANGFDFLVFSLGFSHQLRQLIKRMRYRDLALKRNVTQNVRDRYLVSILRVSARNVRLDVPS